MKYFKNKILQRSFLTEEEYKSTQRDKHIQDGFNDNFAEATSHIPNDYKPFRDGHEFTRDVWVFSEEELANYRKHIIKTYLSAVEKAKYLPKVKEEIKGYRVDIYSNNPNIEKVYYLVMELYDIITFVERVQTIEGNHIISFYFTNAIFVEDLADYLKQIRIKYPETNYTITDILK